jgi:hypothetical protein
MFKFFRSIFGRTSNAESNKAVDEDSSRRLANPEFDALEKEFGTVCLPLRNLYKNLGEITRENVSRVPRRNASQDEYIFAAWYHPADQRSLNERWPDNRRYFEFANDGAGNTYIVDPTLEDPEIIFYDHETGEHKPTGMRLSDYLSLPEESEDGA